MATITNKTEGHLVFPVVGKRSRPVIKQEVVDGCLVEKEDQETFVATVQNKVLMPTLSASEQGELEVTKAELKALREFATFQAWEEKEAIRVHD